MSSVAALWRTGTLACPPPPQRPARVPVVYRVLAAHDAGLLAAPLASLVRDARYGRALPLAIEALARHLFSVDEIVARIEHDVRRSTGQRELRRYGHFVAESEHARGGLPAMERAIVEHLAEDGTIRWSTPRTPATINSLIEQPIK